MVILRSTPTSESCRDGWERIYSILYKIVLQRYIHRYESSMESSASPFLPSLEVHPKPSKVEVVLGIIPSRDDLTYECNGIIHSISSSCFSGMKLQ